MVSIIMRFDLGTGRLGPGKVDLLERIKEHGSIAAAGRSMDMSYRRAWSIIKELEDMFGQPLVEKQQGGKSGGGAAVTPFGEKVIEHYRAAVDASAKASKPHLEAFRAMLDASKRG